MIEVLATVLWDAQRAGRAPGRIRLPGAAAPPVNAMVNVESLHIYPLKSARGIDLGRAVLTPTGLDHDRRWLLVNGDGRFLTQREQPRLALIRTALRGMTLDLQLPACQRSPRRRRARRSRRVRIWNDDVDAIDAGDAAADWASRAIGAACRLVRFDPRQRRLSSRDWTGEGRAPNQFSDGFPVLVANRASLDELNSRLAQPLPMNRFRPNIVLAGLAPWDEDRIDELHIGSVRLKLVKPCTRCRITTIDQDSGTPTAMSRCETLKSYRYDAALRGILFAQNAIILAGVGATLAAGQTWYRTGDEPPPPYACSLPLLTSRNAVQSWQESPGSIARRTTFWAHLACGVAAGLLILLMSVTGVLLTYEKPMVGLVAAAQPPGCGSALRRH